MKFSIGYNHDLKLLDLLSVYKDNIDAFYFPIPRQYLATSRHIPQKSSYPGEIYELIKRCDTLNIKSQLVLNATCNGSLGFGKNHFLKIMRYIEKLKSAGLKSVIVVNPVYMREIKRVIKEIEIESSVNCYVKTVEHALYLRDLGIDVLTVDNDINRDIPLIKKIKDKTGIKIKILLTEACLRNCPFEKIHWNLIAHRDTNSKVELLPDTERWASKLFLKDPAKIFRSSFIPPEGLKYYTSFVDYFKIGSRDMPTNIIEIRLKAYINQKFNGNLLNLLDCVCIPLYFRYIDSRMLDRKGFFKKMLECHDNCQKCNYCNKLVDQAVVTDSYFLDPSDPVRVKEIKKSIKIYKRILKVSPDEIDVYLKLAKTYFNLKHYEEAIRKANKAIELNYKEDNIHFFLGLCYEKTKQYKKAIEEFKKVQKINPARPQINFSLFNCYRNIGQAEQANKELDKGFLKFKKSQQTVV